MKKTTVSLTCVTILLILLVCCLHTTAYTYDFSYNPGDSTAKVADPKVKQGLVKRMVSLLHFKANAERRQKQRVLALLDSLAIKDSLKVNTERLKTLIDSVSEKQDRYHNEVLLLIDSLGKIATAAREEAAQKAPPAPPAPAEPEKAEEAVTDSSTSTDADVADALNALLPAISGQTEAAKKEEKQKRESLSILRKLVNNDSAIVQHQDPHSVKYYLYSFNKQTDFYAFYNGMAPFSWHNFPFHMFNWWVYDALLLNGSTGNFKSLAAWDSSAVMLDSARKAGCNIQFTVLQDNATSVTSFLRSTQAQHNLANNIQYLLAQQKINGVNIDFRILNATDRDYFSTFVSFLSRAIKVNDSSLQVTVTLNSTNPVKAYDITALNAASDRFYISDSTWLTYYLNQKVPASKFVYTIPVTASSMEPIDIISGQFEMVKENKLGGAGIRYSGDNFNYNTAWDAMLFKLTTLDSVLIKDSANAPLTLFQSLYRRLVLYNYILSNPCEECFQDLQNDSLSSATLVQYTRELGIDSIVHARNKIASKKAKTPAELKKLLITEVEYVTKELTQVLLVITILFGMLTLATVIFFILKLKNEGSDWKYKKITARVLTGLSIVLSLFLFAYVFTNDKIPLFSSSVESKERYQSVHQNADGVYYKENFYCYPDNNCANMSLYSLWGVILLGILLGVIIARFLILPLLRRSYIP